MITHLGLSVLAIHGRNKNKNAINDDDDDVIYYHDQHHLSIIITIINNNINVSLFYT